MQKISILSFAKISSSRYDRRIKVAELVRNLEDEKKSHELTKEQLNAAQLSIVNLNLEVTASQQLLSTAQERIEDSAPEAHGLRYRLSIALNKLADSNRRWASAAAATKLLAIIGRTYRRIESTPLRTRPIDSGIRNRLGRSSHQRSVARGNDPGKLFPSVERA